MKTLNEIRSAIKNTTPGLNIKSADEKRFADKHVIQKTSDANGNGDDVFNATNVKGVDRQPKHGYNPGEDEKVYEEVELDEGDVIQFPNRKNDDANKETEVDRKKPGWMLKTDTELAQKLKDAKERAKRKKDKKGS